MNTKTTLKTFALVAALCAGAHAYAAGAQRGDEGERLEGRFRVHGGIQVVEAVSMIRRTSAAMASGESRSVASRRARPVASKM
ncbi:hypothetical protein A8E55_33035 [Burkholderia cenocepacia]|nr:hypothetical protein A8E55_33035 [Burkholderia cenocepacia]